MIDRLRISAGVLLMVLIACSVAMAGGNRGQVGIGLTVTETAPVFMARIWVSNMVTFEPEFGIAHLSIDRPSGSATRYLPGLGFLYHFREGADLRPMLGIRMNIDLLSANDGSYSDIIFGPVLGAEYFISTYFSISGEYQLAVLVTDDELSPSFLASDATYVQSAQLLSVHFYF